MNSPVRQREQTEVAVEVAEVAVEEEEPSPALAAV